MRQGRVKESKVINYTNTQALLQRQLRVWDVSAVTN